MVNVSITKQGSYPVSAPKLKTRLRDFFVKHGIVSDADVSVAIVGEKKMLELGKKYLKDTKLHNVLSFTADELSGSFIYPPEQVIHLGEIVICYPKVTEEANAEGVLIEDKVIELMEHGALHLMGIHHS